MSQHDSTYNGWTNYETWVVALWLDNEQSTQLMCAGMAEEAFDRVNETPTLAPLTGCDVSTEARCDLAGALKDYLEDAAERLELDASMFSDLLSAAMGSVNWHELANHYLSDIEGYVSKPDAGVQA